MTYFPDLDRHSMVWSGPSIRAIGWLSVDHEFTRGPVDDDAVKLLREHIAIAYQTMHMMGTHECEFCHQAHGVKNLLIPTEIFVYIAPELIAHYIEAHDYRPPTEFLAALKSCPRQGSADYLQLMARFQSSPNIAPFGGTQVMG